MGVDKAGGDLPQGPTGSATRAPAFSDKAGGNCLVPAGVQKVQGKCLSPEHLKKIHKSIKEKKAQQGCNQNLYNLRKITCFLKVISASSVCRGRQ